MEVATQCSPAGKINATTRITPKSKVPAQSDGRASLPFFVKGGVLVANFALF